MNQGKVLLAYWRTAHFKIPGGSKARMANRKTPKLTFFNEYLPPGDNEEVYHARLLLIEATRRHVPEFLQELSTRVFPMYEELADSGYDFDQIVWRPSAFKLLTKDRGLKQALEDWADRFNAQAEWLMIGALRTMRAVSFEYVTAALTKEVGDKAPQFAVSFG